jgi:acyl-CoA thioesterase FadM
MFRYFEIAEHALMRAIDMPYAQSLQLREYAFPRVHLEADFRAAILYDDVLDVTAEVERIGSTSWTIHFAAHKAPDGPLCAEGRMTIVAMDFETERAISLPPELRAALGGSSQPQVRAARSE